MSGRFQFLGARKSAVLAAIALSTTALAAPVAVGARPATTASGAGTTAQHSAAVVATMAAAGATAEQEPFLCTTEFNDLGQPLVDNQDKRGTPVYPLDGSGAPDRTKDPLGWSQRCQVTDQVEYRYRSTGGETKVLAPGATDLPADIAMLQVDNLVGADQMDLDGASEIPYLIRYQRGTLPQNRFLYSIAMLVPFSEYLAATSADGPWDDSHWNGRLVFSFGGGVGIGHSQGDLSRGDSLLHEALRLGHAVVYSSGTRTSTHYNLMLGGRTAVELKARFVTDHGDPLYTVGIGGSGGGIQQYVYGQNHPGLLDAALPLYSYPDMTTQTINVGDCELLEYYMDVTDGANPRWADWDNRKILQGQNTIEGFTSEWQARTGDTGSSECIEGWRGATPLAMNPTFGLAVGMDEAIMPYLGELLTKVGAGQPVYPDDFPDLGRMLRTHEDPTQWVEWTHWADVEEVYGTDPATGFARVPWDNVGVQYGLRAVANGTITPEEFLDLNARIGSWKDPQDAQPESCGMVSAMVGDDLGVFAKLIGLCTGDELDQYSSRQMNLAPDSDTPAPRRSADVAAITAAFASGLEFDGSMTRDIPIIDARHYLEDQLDMHNAHQSFVIRERIRRAQGNADNQLIWMLDARPAENEAATDALFDEGFRVMDRWVLNIAANPGAGVAANKTDGATDRCWSTDGTEIARGDDVWDGAVELVESGEGAWTGSAPSEVDGVQVGACAAQFPLHSTSRVVAGGPITNDVYKCHLKSVAQSIADGDYGVWTPTAEQQARLEEIHPDGVCDWSQRSVGYPGSSGPSGPPTTRPPGSDTSTTTSGTTPSTTTTWATTSSTAAVTTSIPGTTSPPPSGGAEDSDDRWWAGDALPRTGVGVLGLVGIALALMGGGTALRRGGRHR